MSAFVVKDAGLWKLVAQTWVRNAGIWQQPKAYVKDAGVWKPLQPIVVQRGNNALPSRATSTALTWAAATAGNLIVIEFACETNTAGPTAPAGYSTGFLNVASGGNLQTSVFYKVASGGETGVTITHGNNLTAWVMREFTSATAVSFATPVSVTTTTPDPPAFSPAGGAKAYMWIAGAAYITAALTSFASGYSNGLTNSISSLLRISSAERVIAKATEDPGALTLDSSVRTTAFTYAVS